MGFVYVTVHMQPASLQVIMFQALCEFRAACAFIPFGDVTFAEGRGVGDQDICSRRYSIIYSLAFARCILERADGIERCGLKVESSSIMEERRSASL